MATSTEAGYAESATKLKRITTNSVIAHRLLEYNGLRRRKQLRALPNGAAVQLSKPTSMPGNSMKSMSETTSPVLLNQSSTSDHACASSVVTHKFFKFLEDATTTSIWLTCCSKMVELEKS
ncbi:hypothetical protein MVEG_09170 [Podila verticillata NRRL 6337]|nr:hypothetical protein MVEG_09170 [Podila verticillata NRRL 6337]